MPFSLARFDLPTMFPHETINTRPTRSTDSGQHVLSTAGLLLLTAIPLGQTPAVPELGELVQSIVVASGPLQFEERKGWGDQVHIFDGWKVEGKGLQARLRPRKKEVNHGLWRHYILRLNDPAQNLIVKFSKLEYVKGRGVDFVIDLQARLDAYANVQQHANGLQLFAAATEGIVDVRAILTGHVSIRFDNTAGQLQLLVAPRIDKVQLALTNIDIDRFGKLRGKMVHEVGDSFRRLLDDLVNDQEEKAVAKINRQIQKEWDDGAIRLPLTLGLSHSLPALVTAIP
jgi:hypothetical protein